MGKYKILGLLLVFFLSGSVFSLEIDFEEAINITYENNAELKELEKDFKIAKLTTGQSFAELFYPSINAGGDYTYRFFTNGENITSYKMGEKTIEITNEFSDNYSVSLGIDKVLFNGFQNYNNHKANELYLELMKKKVEDKKKELKLTLLESYFKLKLLSSEIETLNQQIGLMLKKYEEAKERFRLNQITTLELNQAFLNYQNADLELLKKRHDYLKEQQNLLLILGVKDTNKTILLKNELFDIESILSDSLISDKENLYSISISNDIEYLTYEYNIKKEELNKSALEWSRLPRISAGIDYRLNYEITDRQTGKRDWQGNWSAGLTFSMPLDDLLPNSSLNNQIKYKIENIEKIKIQKEAYLNSFFSTVNSHLFDLEYYKKALEIQKANFEISIENLNYAKKQRELKQINDIDYLNVELSYLKAKNSYESAYYDYWMEVARIERIL
ncbi:MAG: TolC family protein [Brevinematia bacterium]